MVDLKLPLESKPLQALVSEPVKPIIIDLVKVVARPIKKAIANTQPIIEVNLFIFTIFF